MANTPGKLDVISILSTILTAVFVWWTVSGIIKFLALPNLRSDGLHVAFSLGAFVLSGGAAYFAFLIRRRDNRARRVVTALVLCFVFVQVGLMVLATTHETTLRAQLVGSHNEAVSGGLQPPPLSVDQFDSQMRGRTLKGWLTILGISGPLLVIVGFLNYGRFRREFDVAI